MESRRTRGHIGGHDLKGQGVGFSFQTPGLPASSIITAVQQQDYSASVWLRRREKLEHSQQKCIVIFALVCCFAVLLALIFSAVDIWGEDEETEEECTSNCSIVLVENIPADLLFPDNTTFHLPLSAGLNNLLDKAERVVEIVSPKWYLNPSDDESSFYAAARQSKDLLTRLQELKHKDIQLKITTGEFNSKELKDLERNHDAEVHEVNMTALAKAYSYLHSSFWVVDRKHFYIGSAGMDLESLSTRKELGVVVYDCKPLALDLHKVFSLYWGLEHKTFMPNFWSKRLFPFFNRDRPGNLTINSTQFETYISSSLFIPKDRSSDLEAISRVIQQARHFIYISIIDYLPLISMQRYWSGIDGLLREALILRKVRIRLLISCREETHPLTFNFIWSLKSLCLEEDNCSLEAKFFSFQRDGSLSGINHNRFMVTDRGLYIGNLDWVGEEFTHNAGAGLVISHPGNVAEKNFTVVEQLQAVFERDWFSRYANTLQTNKIPVCSKQHINKSVLSKSSHRNYGPLPSRQYDNGPTPLRNHHKVDGVTQDKITHHEDGLRKMISQSLANEQRPFTNNHQERPADIKNDPDDQRQHVKVWKHNISEDPPSRWAESSGFREMLNGSL
ncbi:PREDICTED: inactive phospholipase D5-like isoform X1 [Cyprinodon variegatus]|uniref:inactive phospholipase D5-like isoform X1 n=1 Tax=Cyprinodon variegatus TaxID=28743 RepID=UPI0007427635|nr:PREDICTED: inactive phospholipase D5-like isoform X1 [Cyprinodon variegatus]